MNLDFSILRGVTPIEECRSSRIAKAVESLKDDECIRFGNRLENLEIDSLRTIVKQYAGLRVKVRRTEKETFVWRGRKVGTEEDDLSRNVSSAKAGLRLSERNSPMPSTEAVFDLPDPNGHKKHC